MTKAKLIHLVSLLYNARVIPYRGSWLDFEFDPKDTLFVRIDRRRKLPASILLRSLGYTSEQIVETFFDNVDVTLTEEGFTMTLVPSRLRGETATFDIVDQKGSVVVPAGKKVTPRAVKALIDENKVKSIFVSFEDIIGRFVARDIINEETGEIWAEAGDELTC